MTNDEKSILKSICMLSDNKETALEIENMKLRKECQEREKLNYEAKAIIQRQREEINKLKEQRDACAWALDKIADVLVKHNLVKKNRRGFKNER